MLGTQLMFGSDTSHHQKDVEIQSDIAHGSVFMILKATQGDWHTDDMFRIRWMNLLKYKMKKRGCYHWLDPKNDGRKQAERFIAEVEKAGGLKTGDMCPWVDFEEDAGEMTLEALLEVLDDCLTTLDQWSGMTTGIYTGKWYVDMLMQRAAKRQERIRTLPIELGQRPLWLSDFVHAQPITPKPWGHTTIWQKDNHAGTHGLISGGDFDFFMGSESDLEAICKK